MFEIPRVPWRSVSVTAGLTSAHDVVLVGGLVFDTHGSHFANELEGRDYVIGEMWKNEPPFGLAMNKAMSDDVAWHCKHYTGRGVMSFTSLVQPRPWIWECLSRRWKNQSKPVFRLT